MIDRKGKYKKAIKLISGRRYLKDKFDEARALFEELGDYEDSAEKVAWIDKFKVYSIDDINKAEWGNYIKFGTYNNEEILWYLVKTDEGVIFLLSNSLINKETYKYNDNWENSDIKLWLDWFKDNCFSESEKALIVSVTLLSQGEVYTYLDPGIMNYIDKDGNSVPWWICEKSNNNVEGKIVKYGTNTISESLTDEEAYIRPVIWIKGSLGDLEE